MKKILLLVMLVIFIPITVHAGDEVIVLTYEEAVGMAVGVQFSVRDIDVQLRDLQHRRNELNEDLSLLGQGGQAEQIAADLHRDINEINRQMQSLRLQQERSALETERTLRRTLVSGAEQAAAITALEAVIAHAEENLRRMQRMAQFGMVSANALRVAEHDLLQSQLQLERYVRSKETARQYLNNMLGQPLHRLVRIEFEREAPEIPKDVTAYIAETVPRVPSIRQLQIEIDRAYANLQAHISRQRDEDSILTQREHDAKRRTRASLQEAYDRAVAGRKQAVLDMETAIRRGFGDLENLITQEAARQSALLRAIAQYETARINHGLGRVTRFDVNQAYLTISDAEQNIAHTHNQQWELMFLLKNPTLL